MTSGAQRPVMDDTYHRHNAFPRPQATLGYEAADAGGYRGGRQVAVPQIDAYGADLCYGGIQREPGRLPPVLAQATSHRREPTPPRAHHALATSPSYGEETGWGTSGAGRVWQPEAARADPRLQQYTFPQTTATAPRQQSRPQPDSNFYLLDPAARVPSTVAPAAASSLAQHRPFRPAPEQQAAPGEQPKEGRLSPPPLATPALRCDRCDGPHETERCPHFRNQRDAHPDAWSSYSAQGPATGPGRPPPLRECTAPRRLQRSEARVVAMPGDGSCLFHSLSHGLRAVGYRESGHDVRLRIARFILDHGAQCEISGTPLSSWVEWESRSSVSDYVARLSNEGLWGGAIEMAAAAQIYSVDVAVYEEDRIAGALTRISDFLSRETPRAAVFVLYTGRSHYDAVDVAVDVPVAPAAAPAVQESAYGYGGGYGGDKYADMMARQQRYPPAGAYQQQPYGGHTSYTPQMYASRPEEEDDSWDCTLM